MAQAQFDHWFNMLADPDYAERCRRKSKFRKRKNPKGDYQVGEDVWARHPIDQVMYIASIISIDQQQHTCVVQFVDNGEIVTLSLNHLRHVTRDDIRNNRYVDYGVGRAEYTETGGMAIYDRYGEFQELRFGLVSPRTHPDLFMIEPTDLENDDLSNSPSSDSLESENSDSSSVTHTEKQNDGIPARLFLLPTLVAFTDNATLLSLFPEANEQLIDEIRLLVTSRNTNSSIDSHVSTTPDIDAPQHIASSDQSDNSVLESVESHSTVMKLPTDVAKTEYDDSLLSVYQHIEEITPTSWPSEIQQFNDTRDDFTNTSLNEDAKMSLPIIGLLPTTSIVLDIHDSPIKNIIPLQQSADCSDHLVSHIYDSYQHRTSRRLLTIIITALVICGLSLSVTIVSQTNHGYKYLGATGPPGQVVWQDIISLLLFGLLASSDGLQKLHPQSANLRVFPYTVP